ncbi:MAG: hypothetical protein K8R25_08305 [Methanosarcinales archaeon]|nr:hypothetical protein [Methanosarcinales archaeon]
MSNSEEDTKNCKLHQFQRNNYFYGKLMTVRDFESEQSYFNEKRHLLNRLIHGYGLICVFDYDDITITSNSGTVEITFINGGTALDCCGHEIVVPKGTVKKIINSTGGNISSADLTTLPYLYLRYEPCLSEMVAAASNPSSCDETCCANRIKEDFEVTASNILPVESVPTVYPDFSGDINEDDAVTIIKKWIEESQKLCLECDETDKKLVFLAAVKSDLTIDQGVTGENRRFVCSNNQLYELIRCHLSDFDNPHRALKSINDVGNVGNKSVSNVDIASRDGTIGITSYPDNDEVDVKIALDAVERRHLDDDVINKILHSSDGSVTITPETTKKSINLTTVGANNSSTGLVIFSPESFDRESREAISGWIDPRLGVGPISVILGLVQDEKKYIFIGAIEQFQSFEIPKAHLVAVVDPKKGKFRVGVKRLEVDDTVSIPSTRVQWWAFGPDSDLGEINVGTDIDYIEYNVSRETDLIVVNGLCEDGEKNCQESAEGIKGGRYYARVGSRVAVNGNPKKLADLILEQDVDDQRKLEVGETWDIGEGLTLQVVEIDVDGGEAWISLLYNGEVLDETVVRKGDVYTYCEETIADESDVPMFVIYVETVFTGMNTNLVQLRYAWAISRNITIVE